ncbi:hypothetical protein V9T40_010361 [Parthenolecanium corni]|uniref:Uncharacterized protein n=1 Tax=Parthenolecanium corni TaxID=536013 RepID=A0AAN9Y057_9HEMI
MSEPPTPRCTLTCPEKRQRNASFSVRSENAIDENEKSARKFFTTWRSACDKTKDKTRELLKRTLSWKGPECPEMVEPQEEQRIGRGGGWSVHVWTTWVGRTTLVDEEEEVVPITLSTIQKEKFSHFFYNLLDSDRNDLISKDDFDVLSEKLRHFADWSANSVEFSLLKQVQQELVNKFFSSAEEYSIQGYIQLSDWLRTWEMLLKDVHRMNELPFWLQQLPKVLFLVINRSGNGVLMQQELKTFIISVVGLRNMSDNDLTELYKSMTSNGDFKLKYSVYELCFANWLLCKNPNGPGQWLFGKCGARPDFFPIDYSALNASAADIEMYSPTRKTNRRSVMI